MHLLNNFDWLVCLLFFNNIDLFRLLFLGFFLVGLFYFKLLLFLSSILGILFSRKIDADDFFLYFLGWLLYLRLFFLDFWFIFLHFDVLFDGVVLLFDNLRGLFDW